MGLHQEFTKALDGEWAYTKSPPGTQLSLLVEIRPTPRVHQGSWWRLGLHQESTKALGGLYSGVLVSTKKIAFWPAMGMLDGGMSCRQVARHFGCSPSTITRLLQRHRETGSVNDRPRSGSERVTTPDQDRYIVLQHLRDRFFRSIRKRLQRHLAGTSQELAARLCDDDSTRATCEPVDLPWCHY